MLRAIKITAVLMLVLTLGLHWALLQTVAWTGMIVSYSRDASFSEAVSKTFGGQHPCCMCKVLKQARAEEKQQQQKQESKPDGKIKLALPEAEFVLPSPFGESKLPSVDQWATARTYEPPKPRPRTTISDSGLISGGLCGGRSFVRTGRTSIGKHTTKILNLLK